MGRPASHQFQAVARYVGLLQAAVPMPVAGCVIPLVFQQSWTGQVRAIGAHPSLADVSVTALKRNSGTALEFAELQPSCRPTLPTAHISRMPELCAPVQVNLYDLPKVSLRERDVQSGLVFQPRPFGHC